LKKPSHRQVGGEVLEHAVDSDGEPKSCEGGMGDRRNVGTGGPLLRGITFYGQQRGGRRMRRERKTCLREALGVGTDGLQSKGMCKKDLRKTELNWGK